jgi:hypothetical protein
VPLRRCASCFILVFGATLVGSPAVAQPAAARDKPSKQQCVGANESAQDLQNAGKLRDAAAQLEVCTNKACPGVVRDDCSERLRQVRAAIPTVVFILHDSDGLDVGPSSVVEMDGTPLPAVLDGTPIAVDPGDHVFTFTVAGRPPATRRIALRAGERLRREVQLKGDATSESSHGSAPSAEAPGPGPAPSVEAAPQPYAPPVAARVETGTAEEGRGGWTRSASFAAFGAGGAGVLLSVIFGAVGLAEKSKLTNECPGNVCPPSDRAGVDSFRNNLVAGNVALAVGVAGLASGAALVWLWPPDDRTTTAGALSASPWVGVGALGVGGTFR